MQKNEVPQDRALLGDQREVCYAVDEHGRYVLTETAGWEPANIANLQAWEAIRLELAGVLERIHKGELSPLAYHMAVNLMDEAMLAEYTGLLRWQVRRHLKPGPFGRISASQREHYAALFSIPVEELVRVPDTAAQAMPGTADVGGHHRVGGRTPAGTP